MKTQILTAIGETPLIERPEKALAAIAAWRAIAV